MTQSLGRVSIVLRGAYSNDEQYNRLDVVSFEGSSYCALETTQGIDPTNESYWQKIAERGGEGPQGEVGPIGPDGNGIISIDKISTSGAVDTYRVSMQNGDFYDFEVTNGDGSDWTDVRNKPFNTVDTNVFSVVAGMLSINTEAFATKSDPNFTGFLSLNRKGGMENPAGYRSVAIGSDCVADASAAIAEGFETRSSSRGSHSEGYRTKSSGAEGNHAEGYESEAAGPYQAAHAEGYKSKASGNASHSEGYGTKASGSYSHSEGLETIANGRSQHVQGSYNVPDTNNKYLHIVGNGESDVDRSNAHTLDWNGNAWFAGDVEDGNGNTLSALAYALNGMLVYKYYKITVSATKDAFATHIISDYDPSYVDLSTQGYTLVMTNIRPQSAHVTSCYANNIPGRVVVQTDMAYNGNLNLHIDQLWLKTGAVATLEE